MKSEKKSENRKTAQEQTCRECLEKIRSGLSPADWNSIKKRYLRTDISYVKKVLEGRYGVSIPKDVIRKCLADM